MTRAVERRYGRYFPPGQEITFAIETPSGTSYTFGSGTPEFSIVAKDGTGLKALASLDGSKVATAYMMGNLEVEGDLMAALRLRDFFTDRHPLQYAWRFLHPLLFGQTRSDRKWIAQHYDYPADFYLLFLDRRHRCYSHGVFERDDESLDDAITRKLDFALDAVGAKPGDRILDIGAGWGAMTAHAARRGVHVTSLTISEASAEWVGALIQEEQLPARVLLEHLYEHSPAEPYDAIVNLGVTEHLPDYRRTLHKYLELLRPGGRIYLDASAARMKYDQSTFLVQHVYPGNGTLLCLHEYLAEVARTPFRLIGVHDDRHSYYLTTRAWAVNLDEAQAEVEQQWGAQLYRKFRLYLWACAEAFNRDMTQAYRWVLAKP